MTFGQRIKQRRKELEMTLEVFAPMVGLKPSALSHIESGRNGVERQPQLVPLFEEKLRLAPGELLILLPEDSLARKIADLAAKSAPPQETAKPTLPTLHPVDPADTVEFQDWGEVSAGEPRPQTEPSTVRVPKALLPKSTGTLVMFRVRGQSMTKKYIQDGSVLFVRIDPAPSPGEKVVAVVNSRKKRGPRGYVVKILKQGVDGLELHSASEEEPAQPIPVDDTVDVVGVVVGVFNT